MSLSKIVIMGTVVRNPEKRFTSNNLAVTSFSINIEQGEEESLVRVVTMGKLAETVADTVTKDKIVIVDGRLQTNVAKTTSGDEKKIVEIQGFAVEIVNESAKASKEEDEVLQFDEANMEDELIGER